MGKPIQVLLADDHAMFRAGLRALLESESNIEIVGEASDGDGAVDMARTEEPDIVYLPPQATKLLLKEYKTSEEGSDQSRLHELSSREQEVLALTAEGFSSREIGEKLFISPKTVDTYRSRFMKKLELNHRSELVRFALKVGLLKEV